MRVLFYPIFLECCRFTSDHFWQHVFEDLAYQICPSGTFFDKDLFCCHVKQQEFAYRVFCNDAPIADARTLFEDISHLLRSKRGLLEDKHTLQLFHDQLYQRDATAEGMHTGAHVRGALRTHLLERSALQQGLLYKCPLRVVRRLFSFLAVAVIFKTITLRSAWEIDTTALFLKPLGGGGAREAIESYSFGRIETLKTATQQIIGSHDSNPLSLTFLIPASNRNGKGPARRRRTPCTTATTLLSQSPHVVTAPPSSARALLSLWQEAQEKLVTTTF